MIQKLQIIKLLTFDQQILTNMFLPSIVQENRGRKIAQSHKIKQSMPKHTSLQFHKKSTCKSSSISSIPQQSEIYKSFKKNMLFQTGFKSQEYIPARPWKPNKIKEQRYQTLDKWKGKYLTPKQSDNKLNLELSPQKLRKKQLIFQRHISSKLQIRKNSVNKEQQNLTHYENNNKIQSISPIDFCQELAVTKVNVQKLPPHTLHLLHKKKKLKQIYVQPHMQKQKLKLAIATYRDVVDPASRFNYRQQRFTFDNPSRWNVDSDDFDLNIAVMLQPQN